MSVHLLRGEDPALLSAARLKLVGELLGDGDPNLAVTEFSGDQYLLSELVDAAQTPPFLCDQRIVVGRDLSRFPAGDLEPLVAYLAAPMDGIDLVLEWGGRVPKAIADAVTGAGGASEAVGPGRKVREWSDDKLVDAGLDLDGPGRALVADWLGDEPGQLPGLVDTLLSAYGSDERLGVAEVEPYLTTAGGLPPWDLTDAIDKGDIGGALSVLRRMLDAGRHPMQVLATLNTHVTRLVRLDGAAVADDKAAAALLGLKGSTFPARKARAQASRLGHSSVVRACDLVATADLQMRGTVEWPDDLVLEVLVARLSHLAR